MTSVASQFRSQPIWSVVRSNWRVYAIDGALLGGFMVSACLSVILLEHPALPGRQSIASGFIRRSLVGLAMGMTAVGLIYSRWGKRSGALMNPAMTIGFFRLGRLSAVDALGYVIGQCAGGAVGVLICAALIPSWLRHPSVHYIVTTPGVYGLLIAWLGEFAIALVMMSTVLSVNQRPRLAPFTGYIAAALVWLYITFEAPLSGMSLNPARTFASAIAANVWTGWWIYLTAPALGMLAAIELHRVVSVQHRSLCGKLNHSRHVACFIRCNCLDAHHKRGRHELDAL
jgi:aquaporin Z